MLVVPRKSSAEKLTDLRASIAAIDVVTLAHLFRSHAALTGQLRSIGWTAPSPGLPIVTSVRSSPALVNVLREALAWASIAAELEEARKTLLLSGFAQWPDADYASLATLSDADGCTIPRSLVASAS